MGQSFSLLKWFMGGFLVNINGQMQFTDAEVDYFDFCDIDRMSYLELVFMVEEIGHHGSVYFYWRHCNPALRSDMKLIVTENDVLEMCNNLLPIGISVYVSYVQLPDIVFCGLSSSVVTNGKPGPSFSVVIEEIDEFLGTDLEMRQVKEIDNPNSDFNDSEYELNDGDEEDDGGIKASNATRSNNLREELLIDFHVEDIVGVEIEDDGINDEVNVSEEHFTNAIDDCKDVDQPEKEWPKFSVSDMDDPVFSVGMLFVNRK
ncbi:hypothetical protein PTKIN_Ptkin13bG0089800 [Pterospermum kingtungense]